MLALLPIIAQVFINTNIAIGGTSVLILVSVALQTLRAVESRALMVTYDQYSQPDFFYDSDTTGDAAAGLPTAFMHDCTRRKRASHK